MSVLAVAAASGLSHAQQDRDVAVVLKTNGEVMLGREGVTKIVEYDLNDEEMHALQTSAAGVKTHTEKVKSMINAA